MRGSEVWRTLAYLVTIAINVLVNLIVHFSSVVIFSCFVLILLLVNAVSDECLSMVSICLSLCAYADVAILWAPQTTPVMALLYVCLSLLNRLCTVCCFRSFNYLHLFGNFCLILSLSWTRVRPITNDNINAVWALSLAHRAVCACHVNLRHRTDTGFVR